MTEKTVTKTTEKKAKAAVIKVDDKGVVKSEDKGKVPDAVVALAKELEIDANSLLGWNVYPDRVVIVSMNGMKFSKVLHGSKS